MNATVLPLLASDRTNVNIPVQSRPTLVIGFDYDADVRLFWLPHVDVTQWLR